MRDSIARIGTVDTRLKRAEKLVADAQDILRCLQEDLKGARIVERKYLVLMEDGRELTFKADQALSRGQRVRVERGYYALREGVVLRTWLPGDWTGYTLPVVPA